MSAMGKPSVAVVGAGLGGLSAAISLAADGYPVTVFEKNPQVGGKLNVLKKGGYSFDLGPSILTLPQYFRRLWEKAGKRMEDDVPIQPVAPHWRNFFEDGKVIDLHLDPEKMRAEVAKLGRPGLGARLEKYLRYSARQYDLLAKGYFEAGLDTAGDFSRFYSLPEILRLDYWHTMHGANRRRLREPHLVDIFDYFIKYVGSSARRAPGFLNLMPTIQFRYDLWYVRGGMYNLARGLEKLAVSLGVRFQLKTEVGRLRTESRRVTAVETTDGRVFPADYVVSNMEVIPAYTRLLNAGPDILKPLEKFEPACSGLVLHLGTDKVYPQLAHHNFFYSRRQQAHFDKVFVRHELPDDPTLYVVAPSRTDPGVCPPGGDNIKILPHIPYLAEGHTYTPEDFRALRDLVLDKMERMGLSDLRKHIVVEDMWTPYDIQSRYYSNRGAIYGVVSDRSKNFALKAPKTSAHYDNLFFVGGSVNPGGGMPMVVLSGQNAAKLLDARAQAARSGGKA
jgi:diapolycopene oxygenase